jgi:predicted CoA-substrate-specific enzyme activase
LIIVINIKIIIYYDKNVRRILMNSIGICMGASNIKVVKITRNSEDLKILDYNSLPHEGNAAKTLDKVLAEFDLEEDNNFAVTGRKFKEFVNLPSIAEPEATELAYNQIKNSYPAVDAIVSAGGETFMVYELDEKGKIADVHSDNKCASGTGEFFLQQLKRMDLSLEEAMASAKLDNPHHLSGRCSVFCKSDCTHALNKGEDKGKIVAGLCSMMADKIMELLSNFEAESIMVIGGTSKNNVMIDFLRNKISRVIVPEEADYFEALGTALWGEKHGLALTDSDLYSRDKSSFEFLPPLKNYKDKVSFKEMERGSAEAGDECILGVDVGSTTTKAVIMRKNDDALLASVYLRTSGDPVGAARRCYSKLLEKIGDTDIDIVGLGVTGSGRQIVGLHALTDSIHNEIMAHAKAAVYFDSEVETIFEIGGQDAKYTYIINEVPTDYAMNEACSAGTGSFLEEAAAESFNIDVEDIEQIAMKGENPPNFNDQCSAFISSDIKSAIQEGIEVEDICAGLVYSICLNYTNRVKGNRAVGDKVFMQGGVCYNKAVPIAMAALTDKQIIVPPEPGLMGAYGEALMVKQSLNLELTEEKYFSLKELAEREIKYLNSFICQGGKEDCDRRCEINVMEIKGDKYPFGGACNKYVNLSQDLEYDVKKLDYVRKREKMVYEEYLAEPEQSKIKGKVGINRSLTVSTLLPLYSKFFAELGYEVILPEDSHENGIQQQAAAFCHPVGLSHGYIYDLLYNYETDYIFLPHVRGLYVKNGAEESMLCPMAQAEPYYLSAVWPELKEDNVFSPVLDFKNGFASVEDKFIEIAFKLGIARDKAKNAYKKAVEYQSQFNKELKEKGEEVLEYLRENPDEKAIVLFGRPYNAFVSEANMGIPHKFASRGEIVIPYDMLDIDKRDVSQKMYWSMGQMIMKGTELVSSHPNLFAAYITNFSCGPDSFLLNYFRDINGSKPSLILELDSHTADAGLNTRIEAFLDVVDSYRKLQENKELTLEKKNNFKKAEIKYNDSLRIFDSKGGSYKLDDQHVKVLIPSMGGNASRAVVAGLRYSGINAEAAAEPGEEELKRGRANSSSKECLPLQLTLGTLLNYLEKRKNDDELLAYFMPEASGPCRFGQYNVLLNNLIEEKELENTAVLTLTADNGYAGLGRKFTMRAWQAVITADVLDDIESVILALAENKEKAMSQFRESVDLIFNAFDNHKWSDVKYILKNEAEQLSNIKLKESYENAKKAALTGEIYVRSDKFSRRFLVEKLAKKGIVTKVAPNNEWLYYVDYLIENGINKKELGFFDSLKLKAKNLFQRHIEKTIKDIFADTGLYEYKLTDIDEVIESAENAISKELTGEAVLTIGSSIDEIVEEVDGVIIIGPFGCMPHRVAESVLTKSLEKEKLKAAKKHGNKFTEKVLERFSSLPFLAVETDGSVFTQVIEARIESFALQLERVNKYKNELRKKI